MTSAMKPDDYCRALETLELQGVDAAELILTDSWDYKLLRGLTRFSGHGGVMIMSAVAAAV